MYNCSHFISDNKNESIKKDPILHLLCFYNLEQNQELIAEFGKT